MEDTKNQTEKNNSAHLAGFAILLIILGAIGWYVFEREKGFNDNPNTTATTTSVTTTIKAGDFGNQFPEGVNVEVERITADDAGPAPDMNRPVVFSTAYRDDARVAFLAKLADIKSKIGASHRSPELWNELGLMFDVIEDYMGAMQMWEYTVKLAPKNSITYNNLGFLYGYRLRDYIKAEANFKLAIKNSPQDMYYYQQTFEFYRDVLKDTAKARALAEEGRKKTGDDVYFDSLLKTL